MCSQSLLKSIYSPETYVMKIAMIWEDFSLTVKNLKHEHKFGVSR